MLEVGASKVRITPPIGVPLDGYASRDKPSQGIHDHLYARCVTINSEEHGLALVSIDLLYATRDLTEKVREIVSRETGFQKESIAVVAVHNHSGPSIVGFHMVRRYSFLEEYLNLLPGLVSSGIIRAFNSKRRARAGYGRGEVKGWTINRRKPDAGTRDEELIALRFEDYEGRLISALVNYTCHAVVLGANNYMISGDYPGYVSRTVEAIEGGVCLFLNGAFGDINPLTLGTRIDRVYDRSIGRFEDAIRMGRAIGGEAIKILNSIECKGDLTLSFAYRRVKVRLRPIPEITEDYIDKIEDEFKRASGKDAEETIFKLLSARYLKFIQTTFPQGLADVEVQGFKIGNFVAVLLPGEVFVDLGLAIKSYSRDYVTMVVGCANNLLGYIPTEESFSEGGYEVNLPVCIVERDAGKILVEAACKVIDDLFKGG
ncbi:MAG: neutral/alkaline non-lysosomal ceramidase N-terminal domain-containing protein [Candidatus Bathyarchaeota archaeon]|nr:neutral/alkaline non-lysosomal ceramidase N-terminal domain-containing protein [Candidatus Bathyarchaeota archaeon]